MPLFHRNNWKYHYSTMCTARKACDNYLHYDTHSLQLLQNYRKAITDAIEYVNLKVTTKGMDKKSELRSTYLSKEKECLSQLYKKYKDLETKTQRTEKKSELSRFFDEDEGKFKWSAVCSNHTYWSSYNNSGTPGYGFHV